MADHGELTTQFMNMTSASQDRAKFYLEMANWDLEMAVTHYYDSETSDTPGALSSSAAADDDQPGLTPSTEPYFQGASSSAPRRAAPASSSGRFRTLNDIRSSGSQQDSDDDDRQNFFAGGEKSGMLVQDPTKHEQQQATNVIEEILKKAAAGGSGAGADREEPAESRPIFSGSGYTLGSEEEPSVQVAGSTPAADEEEDFTQTVTRHLTFWRNGFSIDDGPLLRYDDPANSAMLSEINNGRAPLSLLNVRHGQPVDVRVARRQDEDYVPPPKARAKPFESGGGQRLGSPMPASPAPASSSQSSTATPANAPQIDDAQPITTLQIRLADGTRLVGKFNHTHTVGDVRAYIDSQRPGQNNYVLQTSFPVKPLQDNSVTLKDAGLLNSVVIQRNA
ncbi:hypothetical protein BC940DRAFT_310413 [Gongronella butleri]|nr:hypothetical protein BC940DRAFT_310413 [Gongronella butleri]